MHRFTLPTVPYDQNQHEVAKRFARDLTSSCGSVDSRPLYQADLFEAKHFSCIWSGQPRAESEQHFLVYSQGPETFELWVDIKW